MQMHVFLNIQINSVDLEEKIIIMQTQSLESISDRKSVV